MKRSFALTLALLMLAGCTSCGSPAPSAEPYSGQSPAETPSASAETPPVPAQPPSTPAVGAGPADRSFSPAGPEDPLTPAAYDPNAPEGDTASRGYAAVMDELAARLLEYDGSQGDRFSVTVENPFTLPQEELYEFFDTLFLHTVRENPRFFWIDLGDRPHSYDAGTKLVTYSVSIFPDFRGEGFAAACDAFYRALNTVVSEIFHPDMSDMEKVLSASGWIRQYVQYDPETGWDSYSAYSALVDRSAVCHGCAVTMNLLMQQAGIDCCTTLSRVASGDMYHMWNSVKVNGRWYNLDPTAANVPGHQRQFQIRNHAVFQGACAP